MKKKNRKQKFIVHATKLRMISFVLVLVILLGVVPPISLAAEEKVIATEQSLSQEETERTYTYTEITEMRDIFTKHFRRSDGKIVAIVYPEVMHAEKNGEMVDVDNRLSYSKSLGTYRTANDEFAVSFASAASADSTVGITFEGYTLSWRVDVVRNPLSVADQTMTTKQTALREVKQERASLASVATVESRAFENLDAKTTFVKEEITSSFASTSALHYKNAFTGEGSVDLRYTVSQNRVEEDIVINEKSDIRSYVMQITAPELTAVLCEDDSVSFFNDNGDSIFTIGAPWMYDAADEFSIDIEVSLVQDGDSVTVIYTPNAAWLNAKERVYPVVLDPSVKSRNYTSNYVDAYVYTGSTVDDHVLTLGYTKSGINSDGKEFETYTTFTSFPTLFDSMQIESATMTYYAAQNRTGQRMRILNKQTDSKTGAKMNWSTDIYNFSFTNRPLGVGTIYTPTVTQVTSGVYAYTYDFTLSIEEYENIYGSIGNFFPNYFNGFRVYGTSTTTPSINYYSSENTSASYRPVLEITYSYMPNYPIAEDGVYQIQNKNSGKRLMVSDTASSTNVFQFSTASSSLQAFRFVGADGIYTIHPYSRSSEALTWNYSGSSVQNATNVYLASATTAQADKQEFMIQLVSELDNGFCYYAILSRADTSMALTAYGTGTGSTTGTSTTSSGNVYMSKYTGANSQLWCLYSGGLPLMLGNNIREENGEMYEYDLGVSETWFQPYCYVTEYGDTVSFSSSDSTAIEVASNGKLTAKNAGYVNLRATVKNSAGTVKNTYSYTVTLKLENGVYYIKNEASGLYLDATGTSLAEGADVVQSSKIETGDARFGQLWRIHYLGDNLYSIRSMRKLDMGLKAVNGNVALYTIGATDTRTGISDTAEWNFKSSNSYGYRIQQSGSPGLTLEQSGDGFSVGTYDEHVREFWRFEKVNVTPGILLYNQPSYVKIGTTHTVIAAVAEETMLYQDVSWTSSNESVAKVSKGTITAVGAGEAQITVKSTTNSTWKKVFTIDVTYVNEGTYFLRNPQVSKVITATGSGLSAFDNGDNQEYVFEYYVDGYFRIKSVYSGLYLTVEGNSTAKDAAVIHSAWDAATGQLWKIFPTANGRYKLSTMAVEDANISNVLCATNNSTIKQDEWLNNNSYYDEWEIYENYISIVNYYDSSWNTMYNDYIDDAVSFAAQIYETMFGIKIKMDAEPAFYNNAIADECGRHINEPCGEECIADTEYRMHKNIHAISEQLYDSTRENNHVYVMWNDRPFGAYGQWVENNEFYEYQQVLALAVVIEKRPIIQIMTMEDGWDFIGATADGVMSLTQEDIIAFMSINLAHELAHCFGLSDVYGNTHDTVGTSCVMEYYDAMSAKAFVSNVRETGIGFCDSCCSKLSSLVVAKLIEGHS